MTPCPRGWNRRPTLRKFLSPYLASTPRALCVRRQTLLHDRRRVWSAETCVVLKHPEKHTGLSRIRTKIHVAQWRVLRFSFCVSFFSSFFFFFFSRGCRFHRFHLRRKYFYYIMTEHFFYKNFLSQKMYPIIAIIATYQCTNSLFWVYITFRFKSKLFLVIILFKRSM